MSIQENIPLAPYTTFGIGGPARYFSKLTEKAELIPLLQFAQTNKIPWLILGQGSNVLISDKGFSGLVILNQLNRCTLKNNLITVESGFNLQKLIQLAIQNKLGGLENLAGIPGTVGGAVRGNAGSFGTEIGTLVKGGVILNSKLEFQEVEPAYFQFSYRHSALKTNQYILIEVTLKLKKSIHNLQQKYQKILQQKWEKQPREKSAGCIFKNPSNASAGYLIEQCGLKGHQINDARISPQHANFILNTGKATYGDVLQLIQLIQTKVQEKFNIQLKLEIQII
ncbi:UDP-N-acetylenolpyruvoylglucosamine reductase [Candidatus Peregrinibacteria bacterium CG1_02_41_10]|nr:MAG: UDP-N-acetylenolpyruvoylglucosamine reductase [Candidatus Peregrinibacteria bacterium CG1_02_41_10]